MNSPKTALLTQCFPPETHAGANRIGSLATALSGRTDLTVVTVDPSYPHPERYAASTVADHDGALSFPVLRHAAFHPHRGSYAVRALRERLMAAQLSREAGELDTDVICATSPSVFVGLEAGRVARRLGKPFVWDIRDVTWEYLVDESSRGVKGLIRASGAAVLRRAVRSALRTADAVMVSNTGIRDAVLELGAAPEKVSLVPNGVSRDLLTASEGVAARPTAVRPRVTYAGAVGYYQGLDATLDVAQREPGVDFYLVGEGPVREQLQEEAAARGLGNVVFTGYVDRSRLLQLYEESHILFASLRNSRSMATATFPSKPFEYMAAGRPIVYAGSGITAEFLTETECALVAEPENADCIAAAIRRLLDDPDLWEEMVSRGKAQARLHVREDLMEKAVEEVFGPWLAEAGSEPTTEPRGDSVSD